MKKIVLRVAFIAAFAMLACYNLYTSQQEIKMSDLAMANVEALAQGESSEDFTAKTCCIAVWDNTSCSGCDGYTYSYAIRQ